MTKAHSCSPALVAGALVIPALLVVACGGSEDEARAKSAEARTNLSRLYESAAVYYAMERPTSRSLRDLHSDTSCTVESARTSNAPSATAGPIGALPPSFEALEFPAGEPVRYQYEIVSRSAACNHSGAAPLYTFRATGDLDGDGQKSTFELEVSSSASGELVRSGDVTVRNELE